MVSLPQFLADVGYKMAVSPGAFVKILIFKDNESWEGVGLEESTAFENALAKIFPSAAARQMLELVSLPQQKQPVIEPVAESVTPVPSIVPITNGIIRIVNVLKGNRQIEIITSLAHLKDVQKEFQERQSKGEFDAIIDIRFGKRVMWSDKTLKLKLKDNPPLPQPIKRSADSPTLTKPVEISAIDEPKPKINVESKPKSPPIIRPHYPKIQSSSPPIAQETKSSNVPENHKFKSREELIEYLDKAKSKKK